MKKVRYNQIHLTSMVRIMTDACISVGFITLISAMLCTILYPFGNTEKIGSFAYMVLCTGMVFLIIEAYFTKPKK
ncbi:MAG: hypothetical protein UV63_C0001G0068 [Microgenomates group bacterium GW2011_GWC1_43_11]|uniref:Uncharacterized protein n=2 Tax=Candidatus Gottesmaniibacteriota TaxID=1752720 RepID=A0A0G1IR80_9BACT|nr:MAG: hypothetical protein UV63_C0001G0068 [Microgenomates group bacterium GW2011_GWC1_43_11]KKT39157.1 MAG: hypothetical protein UW22_C0001G0068 [Candidatus Gottesmanbacteria bacterium GW2011_GWB1_44_11c]KKT61630.1 MAG: hypothetical protein UW52_C0001G0068 [Candidatus Gottesmanbacteria bacterium GW2011_GWA1_44_24b]HCM82173.1 hypothetical protein [Patescibacteria group bacterium]